MHINQTHKMNNIYFPIFFLNVISTTRHDLKCDGNDTYGVNFHYFEKKKMTERSFFFFFFFCV